MPGKAEQSADRGRAMQRLLQAHHVRLGRAGRREGGAARVVPPPLREMSPAAIRESAAESCTVLLGREVPSHE